MKKYLNLWFAFGLLMVLSLTFVQPFAVYADVNDLLLASGPNAIMTFDLDDDYGISTYSSLGTVTNTIDPSSKVRLNVYFYDSDEVLRNNIIDAIYRNGRWYYSHSVNGIITQVNVILYRSYGSLPAPGTYSTSFDLASDFSYDYSRIDIAGERSADNVATAAYRNTLSSGAWDQFSGDLLISPFVVDVGSVSTLYFRIFIPASQSVSEIGGSFSWRFVQSSDSSAYPSFGSDTSSSDYQSSVSDSLGSISSSLDSAAENLQYISTSQNLIIQGIDNVIMHISDQLYAFWDQLFNLIHLPQMAKMDEIIAAIRKVSNDVDMSQVVDTIEDTTAQQIANDNANTSKVEQAVEKHGNFIIDGLKGLFIPSDEYFKTYFDDLYEYFSDRFGFLSFPIDLLSRLVDLFVNSSDVDCVLTLPGFEISGEQVWTDQSFNLTEFMETNFSFVLTAIRTVTSVYLIMAFVDLCREKWNEVMSN